MAAKAFPGRIVIDHLPKTGGQALTTWLVRELGTGCVSPDLMGLHQELIATYGGLHSIVSGHMTFHDGEGLDPRYQYVTCLREPVDRVLSWLFFVLHDAIPDERAILAKKDAEIFFRSEGKECPDDVLHSYDNFYVHHFSSIFPQNDLSGQCEGVSEEDRLIAARAALLQYDVVGVYEDFRGFTRDVARLIGMRPPRKTSRVNVSTRRPPAEEISPALRERVAELNQYDTRLYSEVIKRKQEGALEEETSKFTSKWRNTAYRIFGFPALLPRGQDKGWQRYNPGEVLLTAPFGSLSVLEPISLMTAAEWKILRVTVSNRSFQHWNDSPRFPLKVGFRWLTASGDACPCQDVATRLPAKPLPPSGELTVDVPVVAPSEPGVYTLILTLLQEQFSALERRGFSPAVIRVVVKHPEQQDAADAMGLRRTDAQGK